MHPYVPILILTTIAAGIALMTYWAVRDMEATNRRVEQVDLPERERIGGHG